MKTTLAKIFIIALFFTGACKRGEAPAKEIKIAADLTQTEMTYLEIALASRQVLPKTKIIFQPTQGLEPKNLLIGNNQPDIFELDFKDRLTLLDSAAELHKFFSGDYERSIFYMNYFQPGVFEGRKYYYMPFRMDWPIFLYNSERVSGPPADFPAMARLCRDRPGSMGIMAGDDEAVLEFMLTVVWAFRGNEFELEDPSTIYAFSYLAAIKNCVTPLSENYDARSLADALSRGEVDFAIAGFDTAFKLWNDRSLPQKISASPVPGRYPVPLSGTFLGVSRASQFPNSAFKIGFFLSDPATCGKIVSSGLWLCAFPYVGLEPPPGRKDLFKPFIESQGRLKPLPMTVDLRRMAKIYREIFNRIVYKGEPSIVVAADMRIELKKLEEGL